MDIEVEVELSKCSGWQDLDGHKDYKKRIHSSGFAEAVEVVEVAPMLVLLVELGKFLVDYGDIEELQAN